ncbi:putative dehydrogenase [Palleronia aestuarii]|uniref:Putative dehydrogenase n=1 Tax=Palleronia aestuarii TaxID=568105 RepID=A0A2W7N7L1_9RHOB|nr:Gfo/Idh/MocA family oxidoreductase [Palleronia aestuarii]PZX16050.1 putative dehydrogenase [Palleronia aestuarii]
MSEPIRWGILGASSFAERSLAPALHLSRGSVFSALATRDVAKAAPFQAINGDLAVHDSYEALLASPDVDAIYVPLPNSLHVEWTIRALEAGKHVLCEKPIAMEEAEFDRMIAARDAAGKLAAEGFMIVHHPQWQKARDLLEEGILGELAHVEVVFSFNNAADTSNIRNLANMGGGGLRDIGVYAFGSVRFATGAEPDVLSARLEMEQDFDVFADVSARFPGFNYHAIVSTRLAKRQSVVFHGRDGVMTLTTPFNAGTFDQAEIHLETRQNEVTVLRYPGVNQYVLQVEAFCRSAREGTPYAWTLEDARGTQRMIDMALADG